MAIKTMKEGCMNEDDFYDEAKIMMRFNHPNLIRYNNGLLYLRHYGATRLYYSFTLFRRRFHGIINQKGQVAILTEFMGYGDLFNYLQKHPSLPAQTTVG